MKVRLIPGTPESPLLQVPKGLNYLLLVERADAWRWGSLRRRVNSVRAPLLLTDWPLAEQPTWTDPVHPPQTEAEMDATGRCILRGCAHGNGDWAPRPAASLGVESTLHPRGRPQVVEKRSD
jgi:hypothetical protein